MADSADPYAGMTMPEYLYKTYNGKGAQPRIYIPAFFLLAIMLAGYVGNALVIMATFTNKKLQGSCNYFIAFGCFADMIHTSAHWVFVYTTAITGENFIPYDRCLWYQTLPLIFITISIIMTLLVGIDRLVSVTFPVAYGKTNKTAIITGGVVLSFACGAYFYGISYLHAFTPEGKNPVLCVIVSALGGRAFFAWFNFCVLVNLIDLVIYSSVWLILRFKAGMSDDSKKVFRSLFAIMLTVAFGWLANAFCQAVIAPAFIKVEYQYEFMVYFGIPVNLASSGGFVTLYIFSQEYRRTFRKLLHLKTTKGGAASTAVTHTSKAESSRKNSS
ncbi:unnamed protein product [Bursaphelenchus xylophilus]|uniref:(pine wood nematode) hypothetical protein n=1 Tax=Bursaphelenchus xylophilus TaxID=6326 RepID=A0A1I7S508_BURXY|nr:srsx-24 [Bursaphelenchus xylophilus]CAD5227361.1 unnamed protein product [Bursaphelenchus xylophilus]CAG9117580.1 unnamed protein product [Bursaphelenchus xylophilus]